MTPNKAYQQYQENSVYTASPEELTLMLYNGMIKFMMQAKAANEEKDVEKAHKFLVRVQDIIDEFVCTLDLRYEISENLLYMYDYITWCLIQENIKKDNTNLDAALNMARELRDTWAEAMKLAKHPNGNATKKVVDG